MRIMTLALAILLLGGALAAQANEGEWKDPRQARLEAAVRALEEAGRRDRGSTAPGVLLRHGDVRMVAGLARVDVVLEIHNAASEPIEWRRDYEIDPGSELIGGILERGRGERIEARTLSLESARRIYGEVRRPRRRTVPGTRGDPLRLERPKGQTLNITVWPVNAGETVRVHLDFVTPLRGPGTHRVFRDVLAPEGDGPTAQPDWLVRPNGLLLADAPVGMVAAGQAGGVLRFVGSARGENRVPTLPLRDRRTVTPVIAVPGGGMMTRVAVWRFDPATFLREQNVRVRDDATLRLVSRRGSTYRIAPHEFTVDGPAMPVTARLSRRADTLRYTVEVVDGNGKVRRRIDVERDVTRTRLEPELEGAITGWHRAAVVRRVLGWAKDNAKKRAQALEYAVDMGVLVEGTAALAVPRAELRTVPRRSRTEYQRDGTPLGAQDGEADLEAPPRGSIRR